jgi:NADPH-dependent ferric siderophore reductase
MAPPSEHTARVAARLQGVVALDLELHGADDVVEGVRELRLAGDLAGFAPWPGQDLMVSVPPGAATARFRRYTVRRWDPVAGTVELWVTTATDGPGARWAVTAATGDHVDAVGPRGKIALDPRAAAHLFVVDESGLAAACAMAEALDAPAAVHSVLALDHSNGAVPHELAPSVRDGVSLSVSSVPADDPAALRGAIDRATSSIETSSAAGYVFGELGLTREAAKALASIGLDTERVAVKPYWRNDRANEANGEPDRTGGSE